MEICLEVEGEEGIVGEEGVVGEEAEGAAGGEFSYICSSFLLLPRGVG